MLLSKSLRKKVFKINEQRHNKCRDIAGGRRDQSPIPLNTKKNKTLSSSTFNLTLLWLSLHCANVKHWLLFSSPITEAYRLDFLLARLHRLIANENKFQNVRKRKKKSVSLGPSVEMISVVKAKYTSLHVLVRTAKYCLSDH